ncbi:hypothetical protein D3C80_1803290 [compost metagenome]
MILRKLEKHWPEIAKIGVDAEERGRPLGLRPSWADAPEDSAIRAVRPPVDVRRQAVADFRKAK